MEIFANCGERDTDRGGSESLILGGPVADPLTVKPRRTISLCRRLGVVSASFPHSLTSPPSTTLTRLSFTNPTVTAKGNNNTSFMRQSKQREGEGRWGKRGGIPSLSMIVMGMA